MSYELGSAYITVLPSFKSFGKDLTRGIQTDFTKAGATGGKSMADGAEKSMKANAKRIFAPLVAAGAALGGVALFKDIVNGASDVEQALGATEAIYGKHADSIIKKAEQADKAMGMSKGDYLENSNLISSLLKNQGVPLDQLAGKTDNLMTLSADLAATYGGPVTDSSAAVSAALRGEYEQLEKYGVTIKKSDINTRLAAEGKDKLTGAALKQAEQEATLALLYEQSESAQGMAAKEANTYAGQMQRLQATLANTRDTIGAALLPIITGFVSTINSNVLPAVEGFIAGMKDGTGWGGKVADTFGTIKDGAQTAFDYVKTNVVPTIQDFVEEFKNGEGAGGRLRTAVDAIKSAMETAFGYVKNDVIPTLKDMWQWVKDNNETLKTAALYVGAVGLAVLTYKGYVAAAQLATQLHTMWINRQTVAQKLSIIWTKAQTVAQRALNLAMKMNPIGLVIAAITLLVGALAIAYKRHEGFRNLVNSVWAKIKSAAGSVVTWFQTTAWPVLKDVINKIGSVVKWLWEHIYRPYFTFILDKVKAVVGWIKDTAWPWMRDAFANIGSKAGDLKNKAVAAFDGIKSGISNAWDGAKRILDRFKGGLQSIKDKFQSVKDGIARVWSSLGAAIAKPINTVIDTVNRFLNRVQDGINDIPGVNLTGTWGSIPNVPVPGALTTAASTAGRRTSGGAVMLASGGQVPGWSPNDRADNIPAWLTAGEYVLPVKATERLRSMLGADGLEHLRNGQLPAYADGGLIGDGRGGPVGWVKDKWDDVVGFFENAKGWVKGLWNRLMPDFGNSWAGQAVKGVMGNIDMGKIASAVMEKATGAIGGLNASGSNAAMPWQAIWSLVQQIAPEARKTSDHRPGARTAGYGNLSYHARGRAIDIVSNDMMSTYRKVVGALPWSEAIFSPAGNRQVRNGRYYMETNPVTRSQHWDHIHLAMAKGGLVPNLYDEGGAIMPGLSLVANQTGKPEMVLTNDQWTDIREAHGGDTIVINGVKTENATDVADELLFALKRTERGKYNRVR